MTAVRFTTDWVLIRRVAAELDRALAGARVVDAGLLEDGRIALHLSRRGTRTLAIDAFGSPPLVTLEEGRLAVIAEPGWLRATGTALRGTRLQSVDARQADRVLVFFFASASRFAVANELRLVVELVPRYGNVVLLRDRIAVAAAKQFSPAENEARSVQIGLPYEPPPLPRSRADFAAFTGALEAAIDATTRSRALGQYLPEVPRALALSVAFESLAESPTPAAQLASRLEGRARAVLADATSDDAATRELYVYRVPSGAIVAAHVVPLAQYRSDPSERRPSLLGVFAEARAAGAAARAGDATERRRSALIARIAKRDATTAGELAALRSRLADARARDVLRRSGDALYTHANEIAPGTDRFVPPSDPEIVVELDPVLEVKENAQRYYARYRKASDALPHLERRIEALRARAEALEVLAFEAGRADGDALAEVEADLDELEGRRPQRATKPPGRAREPLRLERPSGARIYVGRSPRENAEVTFRIARPNDLWFHARGIPGSHVVLQPPPGAPPREEDLDAAADLAATHSRAKQAGRVEVDYTERKYVRKQRDAAPGLVWYTNARTRLGRSVS